MTGIGSFSNIALGAELRLDEDNIDSYQAWNTVQHYNNLSEELIIAWDGLFFIINTTMTMSIIYKIMYVSHLSSIYMLIHSIVFSSSARRTRGLTSTCKDHHVYNTVIRAIIESSLIAWVGLLVYATTSAYFYAHLEALDGIVSGLFNKDHLHVLLTVLSGRAGLLTNLQPVSVYLRWSLYSCYHDGRSNVSRCVRGSRKA
jgi:hypothetical protein